MKKILLKHPEWDLFVNDKNLGRLNFAESKIITLLANSKGDILEKNYLLDNGWPSKVVSPNSLNVAVKNIRCYLDGIDYQDVIITHPKRGFSWNNEYRLEHEYRLEQEQEQEQDKLPSSAADATPTVVTVTSLINRGNSSLKMITFLSINTLLLTYIIFISSFYFIYKADLQCHKINDIVLCGVGALQQKDIKITNPSTQKYVYGYTPSNRSFIYAEVE